MESIEEMRAVCVAHYAERGHSPAHADLIVPKDEKEIRRIYSIIQEEKKRKIKIIHHKIAGLDIVETVLIDEETAAE